MFDFEETSQIVSLKEHQSDKASIELLVAFNFVLKLAPLVPVQLLFIHR